MKLKRKRLNEIFVREHEPQSTQTPQIYVVYIFLLRQKSGDEINYEVKHHVVLSSLAFYTCEICMWKNTD